MKLSLDLIMPMAGKGERVKSLNQIVAKPFIILEGKPLYQHALESLTKSFDIVSKTAVIREDSQVEPLGFASVRVPETNGPLESAMLGVAALESDRPICVLDCDLTFELSESISAINNDVILLTFNSDIPRYSYALSTNGKVSAVAEKKVISNRAIAGCYIFKSSTEFIRLAKELLSPRPSKELFISHLVQHYLDKNKSVCERPLKSHLSLGTAEEIIHSGKWPSR